MPVLVNLFQKDHGNKEEEDGGGENEKGYGSGRVIVNEVGVRKKDTPCLRSASLLIGLT